VSINKLYRERDKARTIVNTFEEQAQTGETQYTRREVAEAYQRKRILEQVTSHLSDLRKVEEQINKANIADDLKESAATYLNIQMINAARQALGKNKMNIEEHMEPRELMQVKTLFNRLQGGR
jgi:hypothetical protein